MEVKGNDNIVNDIEDWSNATNKVSFSLYKFRKTVTTAGKNKFYWNQFMLENASEKSGEKSSRELAVLFAAKKKIERKTWDSEKFAVSKSLFASTAWCWHECNSSNGTEYTFCKQM